MQTGSNDGRQTNCFDAVRLMAASAVIFDHAYALSTSDVRLGLLSNSVGSIAVKIFFVVSGYLIFSSWERDKNLPRYLIRRGLRIFPAMIVLCILTVFFLGPIFTSLSISEFFGRRETWYYFYNVILYPVYSMPGVFLENTYPSAINGSLWTLPVEFAMYLVLPAVAMLSERLSRRFVLIWVVLVCGASLWFVIISPPSHVPVVYGTLTTAALGIIPYFFIGMLVRVMEWERFLDPVVALVAVALVSLVQPIGAVGNELILYVLLPYATLSVALSSQKWLSRVGRFGDFSYGVYIYAFPIQQMLYAITANRLMPLANAGGALLISLIFSFISWRLVEAPALRLKPGRRKRDVHALNVAT